MKISINKSWSLSALLKGILAGAFLFSAATQAQVAADCADGTDANCVASFTGGLWNEQGLGQCLFVLPTAETREFEYPLGPDVDTNTAHVCIGGLADTNLTTNDDVALRILRGTGADEAGAFSWTYGDNYPASLASAQFIPESCGLSGDFDSTNPNRRNGTFDNGDKFGTNGPRDVIEPMSAELTLDFDVTGDATLSYYFMNGSKECRDLEWSLKIGGILVKTGNIANFKDGKYLVFNLTGLQGGETIRLDVVNPYQPGGGTPPSCTPDLTPGVNSVISGVFVEGTSVCADPPKAALGDRVWVDLNEDGLQNCEDGGANDPNNLADGIIGNAGDAGPECDTGVANVPVRLRVDNGDGLCGGGDTTIRSTTTDANGFYLFDNLEPGGYCLAWTKPDGFDCTDEDVQGNAFDAIDSDGTDLGAICRLQNVPLIDLQPGEDDRTWDLGLVRIPPPVASLGDRVWEDLDGDGVQDCSDDNNNDVIGDAGDSGPECDEGVENVTVNLFMPDANGDCTIPMAVAPDTTDENGFYSFTDLPAGDYCVQFNLSTVDPLFCETDGFDLGAPLFTVQNQGDDATDSDADSDGSSESVTLAAGDSNLTLDAGIVCPAKIGDQVWLDTDNDGTQNETGTGVEGVTVALWSCGPDGVKGGGDDFLTGDERITDEFGMYMFGAEDDFDLAPGCYSLTFEDPEGREFTLPNQGNDLLDSDCAGDMGMTGQIDVGGRTVDLSNDCGLIPPPNCDLQLVKGCRVETPEVPEFTGDCKGKLQQFTLIWNPPTGVTGSVTASGPNNSVDLFPGDEATFVGPFDNNDVFVNIAGAVTGRSVFHVSCSDDDFDGPEDCGMPAGNGKGDDDSKGLNDWLLEGFVDAENKVLDCNTAPADGPFLEQCTFEAPTPRSCENSDKPRKMTFQYTGGGCDASDNGQDADKAVCESNGTVSGPLTFIIASGDDKFENDMYEVSETTVQPDGTFDVSFFGDNFKSTSFVRIMDGNGVTETNELHTSCSQPLAVGDVFGSLALVGWDNYQDGVDVTYSYALSNSGDDLSGIKIVDDPLGLVASGISLASGASDTFYASARISDTTSNTATASTTLAGELCFANSDTVTVTAVVPPCNVGFELDKVEDDNLKIKVRNNDGRNRIVELQSLEVSFPSARMDIREIKLDGAIYKRDDSSNPVNGTSALIGPDDWTNADVTKRQLDPGERRTLEIKTTKKSNKDTARFEVTLNFGPECVYKLIIDDKRLVSVQML